MFYFEKDYPPTWVCIAAHSIPMPFNLYLYSADAKKLKVLKIHIPEIL